MAVRVDSMEPRVFPDSTVSLGGVFLVGEGSSSASTCTSVAGGVGLVEACHCSRSSASGSGVGLLCDD